MTTENTKTNSIKKKHLLDHAGIWADIPEKEWKEFEQNLNKRVQKQLKGLKKWTKKTEWIFMNCKIVYFSLTASKFLGAEVSMRMNLCIALAKSRQRTDSPWFTMTFLGLGLHL